MPNLIAAGVVAAVALLQPPQARTAAQQPPEDKRSHERTVSRPWAGLFVVKPIGTSGQPRAKIIEVPVRAVEQAVSPRVLTAERGPCNMPIIRANPEVDPKMVIPIREEGVDAKIRVIEPTVCGTHDRADR